MEGQYIIKGPKCGSPTPIAISWRPLHSEWQPFLRHDLQWCVSVFLDWFFCQVSYPEDSPSFPNWFKLFIKLFKLLLLKIQTPLKNPTPRGHHFNLTVQCMSSEDTRYVRAKHWVKRLRLWRCMFSCLWKQCSLNQNVAWMDLKSKFKWIPPNDQPLKFPFTLHIPKFKSTSKDWRFHFWCPTAFDFRS